MRSAAQWATRLAGAIIAFEVDEFERADFPGWVVLVVGRCDVATGPLLPSRAVASLPRWTATVGSWLALDGETAIWRGLRAL